MANLETAIQRSQEVLDDILDGVPDRASQLQSLGTGYRSRYQRIRVIADLETAIQRYQEALDYSSFHIAIRLEVSIYLLELHIEAENWSLTYRTTSIGVYFIPLLTSRFLENANKQNLLTRAVGLASNATAIALIARKTQYKAI